MLTPQESYPQLAKALGVPSVIFKREDLHKYGSHKGRSIPQMIAQYANQGYNDFVISSSGNAALAAIHLAREYNFDNPHRQITLKIFVGKNINEEKLKILQNELSTGVTMEQVKNPKQSAFQAEKTLRHGSGQVKNLRQSTDNSALEGYKTLAEELNIIKNLQAVFIPTSSGTTAEALGKFLPQETQIHIIQTTACHPIAEMFDKNFTPEKTSLASAIVDKTAHRKEKVLQTIKNSGGSGWVISNDEIKSAIKLVKGKTGIDISPNSALSVAGLIKAVRNDHVKSRLSRDHVASWKFDGEVVCLITGK